MAGEIGTFDDLFGRLARAGGEHRRSPPTTQRTLIVRGVIARARLNGWTRSARSSAASRMPCRGPRPSSESGLVEPRSWREISPGSMRTNRAELDSLGLWDRDLERRAAAERLAASWERGRAGPFLRTASRSDRRTVGVLEALAGRAEVTVRRCRMSLAARLRVTSSERLPISRSLRARGRGAARPPEVRPPAWLIWSERSSRRWRTGQAPEIDGAIRYFEVPAGAGRWSGLAEELLALDPRRTAPEQIALVCPRVERYRAPLEDALGSLGVPYAIEGRIGRADRVGRALLSLFALAWQGGEPRRSLRLPGARPTRVSRARVSTGSRGGLRGRGRRDRASGRRKRRCGSATATTCRRSSSSGTRRRPSLAAGRSGALHASLPLRPRRAARRRAVAGGSSCLRRPVATPGRARGMAGAWRLADPGRDRGALERAPVAPAVARAQPAAESTSSISCAPGRAATRSPFILGLEEGSLHTAARRRRFLDEETARGARRPPAPLAPR